MSLGWRDQEKIRHSNSTCIGSFSMYSYVYVTAGSDIFNRSFAFPFQWIVLVCPRLSKQMWLFVSKRKKKLGRFLLKKHNWMDRYFFFPLVSFGHVFLDPSVFSTFLSATWSDSMVRERKPPIGLGKKKHNKTRHKTKEWAPLWLSGLTTDCGKIEIFYLEHTRTLIRICTLLQRPTAFWNKWWSKFLLGQKKITNK